MIRQQATPRGLVLTCTVCGASQVVRYQQDADAFSRAHAHADPKPYMGLGDVVAAGIKRLTGIKPCPPCERRKQILNQLAPRVWKR